MNTWTCANAGARPGGLEVSDVEEQKYKNHEGIDRDRHDICSPIPPFFLGFIAHDLLPTVSVICLILVNSSD